jgi:putative pyoverdin transport system ATP-binding/permease protein
MEINLRGSADKLRRKNTKAAENFIIANGFGQIAQFASLGFMLFLLPSLISLPLPILASYVLISTFLALPLQNLLNRMPELVRGNVALQKIERMNLSLINIAEPDQVPALIQTNCQLQLQDVVYRYHPDLPSDPHSHPDEPEADFPPDHPPLPAHELDRDSSFTGDRQHEHPHPSHPDRLTDQQSPERQSPNRQSPDHQSPNRDRQHRHPHPPHPQHRPTGSQDSRPNLQHPHPHPQHPQRLPPPHPDFGEQGFKLGPIDLNMRSGELIFIVGSNGSGKSTLAKLITGLYTPRSGQISLNGEPITEANVEWYRQHFATTFADAYLFDSYLGFDNPQLDREVGKYLQEFQLDQKVSVNNGVLSTTSLSQGQRKRLALLTAFLEDRPIYLFDEWASDQDPTFREIFYEQMLIQLKNRGKLVIVITHDDRYFHLADRILQLNYGRVE